MYRIIRSYRGFLYVQQIDSNDWWHFVIRNAPKGLHDGDYAKYVSRIKYYPIPEDAMDTIFEGWRDCPEILQKRAFMFGEPLLSESDLD